MLQNCGAQGDARQGEKRFLQTASCSDNVTPAKVGRPSSQTPARDTIGRTRRSGRGEPKRKICVFQCDHPEDIEDLHITETDAMGGRLIYIRDNTNSDKVRACLSLLHKASDASALEIWYHRKCLRMHERECERNTQTTPDETLSKRMSDIEIINTVKCSLSVGESMTMRDVNKQYLCILAENGTITDAHDYKKHLKQLILDNISDIEFVRPYKQNESEHLITTKTLGVAVDSAVTKPDALDIVVDAAAIMRKELVDPHRTWTFNGSMDYLNPPITAFFLKQLLFGTKSRAVSTKRDDDVRNTISVVSQVLAQNVKSDRQIMYAPKTDAGFSTHTQTPLSIGLGLSIHNKIRSKVLVNCLSKLNLGTTYEGVINLEKRIECGVVERMRASGGYCIPQCIRKGTSVFFAIDNIDFLEDTCYGQNTLHGTVVVMNQEDNGEGERVNAPLTIPDKITPVQLQVQYNADPRVVEKPIQFMNYEFNSESDMLKKYEVKDRSWALANHLGNAIPATNVRTVDESDTNTQNTCADSSIASNVVATEAEVDAHMDDTPIEDPSNSRNITEFDSILQTTRDSRSENEKTKSSPKSSVMPTWAATNSLLLPTGNVAKTHSEVVTPLFRQAPTDYATLYTALSLTQNISAVVMGPERKTVITLDLALYERAIKIQSSTGNSHWVLRAGELHICFAALHALGKYIEGSGLDTVAVETGIYSPVTLRQIFAGKAFKRGIEYHIMNALACYYLKYEQMIDIVHPETLVEKCSHLRRCLHARDEDSGDVFEDVCAHYSREIDNQMTEQQTGDLGKFLTNYLHQVECLLHLIRACRQGDWEEYLAALDEQIKYFFAHDLYNYSRLMPIHLAQMNDLKTTNPETWTALKDGDFCVKKTGIPFTNLFVDQTLEQCIKELKVAGGITGITQNESALNRFLFTAPEMTRIVNEFQSRYAAGARAQRTEHYQLSGSIGLRSATNAVKIKDCLERHCDGNPFMTEIPLVNIVSMMTVPDNATVDIVERDEKGTTRYKDFVENRLKSASSLSVWDRITKMKLKTFSTCLKKTNVAGNNKVVKLREDRQLLARFLVVQQSRPDLVDKLGDTIGNYELAVTPRSLFATDGTLLLPTDKSAFMKEIESYKTPLVSASQTVSEANVDVCQTMHRVTDDTRFPEELSSSAVNVNERGSSQIESDVDEHEVYTDTPSECEYETIREKVIIIDAQAVVQGIKKSPGMEKISDFGDAFVTRIARMTNGYSEGRVIFDRYTTASLKEKTRVKRAGNTEPVKFLIHDSQNIRNVSIKLLLSHSETKAQLTEYLGKRLLEYFAQKTIGLVVVYGTSVHTNKPNLVHPNMMTHGHEEADTQIPLHVIDVTEQSQSVRDVYVWSPDTDVFLLLMDVAATENIPGHLKLLTGRGKYFRVIDVKERCVALGPEKTKGLVGLHNFTGADWGGKFFNVSKKSWITRYLSLASDSDIVRSLQQLGTADSPSENDIANLDQFVCEAYSPKSSCKTVRDLRWELFRTKNLESEKLPPTLGTLKPHIQRANFISARDKSYREPMPQLPPLEENGWESGIDGKLSAVKCLNAPAPLAVLELVKCGCKGSCHGKRNCSCQKNMVPCTPLCKCSDCSNIEPYKIVDNEDL